MIKKLLITLFFISLVFVAPALGAEINCTTLVADGGGAKTDNTAALNTCLASAAAESEKICNIPSSGGDWYYWASQVTVPEGVSVIGASGLTSDVEGGFLLPNDDAKIIGIEFKAGSLRPIEINNEDSAPVDGIHIRDNYFTYGGGTAVITAWNANNCIIDNNEIDNNTLIADNIEFQAGDYNIIVNNVIDGGQVGIIFKFDRRSNGPDKEGFYRNVIMNNTITNVDEEFISADMGVNNAGAVPHMESDEVSAINGAIITLGDTGWDDGTVDYTGYYMVVLTDDDEGDEGAQGEYRLISSHTGDDFTLASAITGLEVGDWVSINSLFLENYIAFNTCSGGGFPQSCPILYGNSFYNRIEENSSNGMRVNSMTDHHQSTANETGNCGRGPSGYNLFRANVVTTFYDGASCTEPGNPLNCRLAAYERDFTICWDDFSAGAGSTYRLFGDVAVDNTVGNVLEWSDVKDYYLNNNTYDTKTTTNSTDAGSTTLDVTSFTCEEYGMYCVSSDATIARVTDLDGSCSGATVCSGTSAASSSPIQGLLIQ